jgi:hypothetical protein
MMASYLNFGTIASLMIDRCNEDYRRPCANPSNRLQRSAHKSALPASLCRSQHVTW